MQTLGIDLSTDPKKVWTCEIDWSESPPKVISLEQLSQVRDPLLPPGAGEEIEVTRGSGPPVMSRVVRNGRPLPGIRTEASLIAELVERITAFAPSAERVVGLGAPLGWPVPFVEAISDWDEGDLQGFRKRPDLRLRTTDRFLQLVARVTPMSVSTDRTGSTAMLLAEVLSRSARRLDRPAFDRCGATDGIAEVNPAAALRAWADVAGEPIAFGSYKGWRVPRETIVLKFVQAGLEITPRQGEAMCESSDALDAFVCALVARAVALEQTITPSGTIDADELVPRPSGGADSVEAFTQRLDAARALQVEAVRTGASEGWIHVPRRGPLSTALDTTPGSATWEPPQSWDPAWEDPTLTPPDWAYENGFDDEGDEFGAPPLSPADRIALETLQARARDAGWARATAMARGAGVGPAPAFDDDLFSVSVP
ncbi:MAG: DUF429 domain-containing protein [Solirubrobacteraceae bacterium]|nr:DUF429 domain-containing protein [Solirubrobacteraceae bacterium]